MAYTDEQINKVVDEVEKSFNGFTTVQNKTFCSTYIINGMKAEKTANEIAEDIWQAYKGLSAYPDQYGLVGQAATNGRVNLLNCIQHASGVLRAEIAKADAENEANANTEEEQQDEPGT